MTALSATRASAAPSAAPAPLPSDRLRRTVEAAAGGDARAWGALVTTFGGLVRSVARSYRLSAADVDDVSQETWVRLFQHVRQVEDPAAVAGWLVTTTRRQALRALQRGVREQPWPETPDTGETDPCDPLADVVAAEACAALDEAIGRLPAHQRALVRALLDDPYASYDDVADRLATPRGSVGPTRGRALERLRRDLTLASAIR